MPKPKAESLFPKLKEIVGESNTVRDPEQLKAATVDGKRPKMIIFPETIDQVSRIVAFASSENLKIVPGGNRTKMGTGGIPEKVDLFLSMLRLNRITDCDTDNLTLSVESGITLGEVQKRLAGEGKGYFLPLDPPFSERATLGGIVATHSSGPKRLIYGTSRDLITGIKAVFPNGDVVVSGGKTVKNVSGYDLCKLLIGSYGTLGVLCEMTFKLLPLPEGGETLLFLFDGLEKVEGFVREVRSSQLLPSSMEVLNATALQEMNVSLPVPFRGGYLVAIGLEGVLEGVERQVSELSERGKKHGALETSVLDSEGSSAFWVGLRDFACHLDRSYPNLLCLKSNFLISKSGEMLGVHERIAKDSGIDCALVCHAGSGILYTYALRGKTGRSKTGGLIDIIGKLSSEALKNMGNLVVESSPLKVKRKVDVWGQPGKDISVMHRLKKEIDPQGTLNPGRFAGGI